VSLEESLDPSKIWLVIKESTDAAIDLVWWALEIQTLPLQLCFLDEPLLLEYCGHPFEYPCMRVTFWEVKQLRLAV
jgi:hypothetical protein